MRRTPTVTVADIDRTLTRCAERLTTTTDLPTYRHLWEQIDELLDRRNTTIPLEAP